ncbi:MAG: ATP-grasp domain-containing protein [Burkholderiaceae bacterium]|nr:ATP-grasp domain-containing protein [Burkholderiaceae bacterium]
MGFHKILIANRGEIACRVMRSARTLGYRTVAVFSAADADAAHVAQADEAVAIGPAPAADSYLSIPALLAAARATGADAVHPGYGFLSERADFAQACADAGLVFIGPPPAAITAMGNKAAAKRRMHAAGVPCAPGYLGDDQSDERLVAEGRALGAPLLVKAVAGGGGRGMRLVHDLADLPAALAGARREALGAFGDATLMLERLIERGRHIEVQVFADSHGHCIHLGERDCTAQRRRQKVIEEAPSPVVDAAMRARLGADAVAAARAVGYVGAGTVEFIVDAAMNHWFLEMNTRLQVEHPVTEAVTGLDLVAWQLRIAAGEPLPIAQEQLCLDGHAIEVRLYAEDPYLGFLPQTGPVRHWRPQAALRDGVRIDAGIAEGGQVTPHYDAMVAKLIAHGRDRDDAIRRLRAALADAPLLGLAHNARFLHQLLDRDEFRSARLHTGLLDDWAALPAGERPAPLRPPEPDEALWALAAAAWVWGASLAGADGPAAGAERPLRPAAVAARDLHLSLGGTRRRLRVALAGAGRVSVTLGDAVLTLQCLGWHDHGLRYDVDGVRRQAVACAGVGDDGQPQLHLARPVDAGLGWTVAEVSAWPRRDDAADPRRTRAPLAGTVAALAVAVGDRVAAGAPLVCVEAMKMEMWLNARAAGRVTAVHVQPKDSVAAGALLVELDTDETTSEETVE